MTFFFKSTAKVLHFSKVLSAFGVMCRDCTGKSALEAIFRGCPPNQCRIFRTGIGQPTEVGDGQKERCLVLVKRLGLSSASAKMCEN